MSPKIFYSNFVLWMGLVLLMDVKIQARKLSSLDILREREPSHFFEPLFDSRPSNTKYNRIRESLKDDFRKESKINTSRPLDIE